MSKKSLNILFYPTDAVGHINAATGIAEVLMLAGHQCQFIISKNWSGKLSRLGIQEIVLDASDAVDDHDNKSINSNNNQQSTTLEDPALYWANRMKDTGTFTGLEPVTRLCNVRKQLYQAEMDDIERVKPLIERLLIKLKPDIIFTDQFMTVPAIDTAGIPWVWWCSPNPLVFLDDEQLTPPGCSGLPTTGPRSEWQACRAAVDEASADTWNYWNGYCTGKGVRPFDKYKYLHFSPYLNIYGFPKELDYTDIRPLPANWCQFDNLKRTDNHQSKFEIPAQLRDKPGKLVYFSLGSMGGADIDLMKRLVGILAKSPNRFIVSKGPGHHLYDLADNMWGQPTVPQIQVLLLVDLVITHGGNNTVTETFYFGKPMIVLPLFGDQWDNGQRIHEKSLGIKLNAHNCTESELLNAIESLLNDNSLNEKLQKISQRIQSDNSIAKLPRMIQDIFAKHVK